MSGRTSVQSCTQVYNSTQQLEGDDEEPAQPPPRPAGPAGLQAPVFSWVRWEVFAFFNSHELLNLEVAWNSDSSSASRNDSSVENTSEGFSNTITPIVQTFDSIYKRDLTLLLGFVKKNYCKKDHTIVRCIPLSFDDRWACFLKLFSQESARLPRRHFVWARYRALRWGGAQLTIKLPSTVEDYSDDEEEDDEDDQRPFTREELKLKTIRGIQKKQEKSKKAGRRNWRSSSRDGFCYGPAEVPVRVVGCILPNIFCRLWTAAACGRHLDFHYCCIVELTDYYGKEF